MSETAKKEESKLAWALVKMKKTRPSSMGLYEKYIPFIEILERHFLEHLNNTHDDVLEKLSEKALKKGYGYPVMEVAFLVKRDEPFIRVSISLSPGICEGKMIEATTDECELNIFDFVVKDSDYRESYGMLVGVITTQMGEKLKAILNDLSDESQDQINNKDQKMSETKKETNTRSNQ